MIKLFEYKYDIWICIFFNLDSLEWLNLAGNQLDSVPSEALKRLVRLRQLDLRGNLISAVHEDDFQSFGKTLKFVHLQKNQYVNLNTFVFVVCLYIWWYFYAIIIMFVWYTFLLVICFLRYQKVLSRKRKSFKQIKIYKYK